MAGVGHAGHVMPADRPKSIEMLAPVIAAADGWREEPDQLGDLGRLDEPRVAALRIAAQQLVEVRHGIGAGGRLAAQHRRVDVARADGVDPDADGRKLQRERTGEVRHAALRRAVHRGTGVALHPGVGRHVDDATTGGGEVRDGRRADEVEALEVDVDDPIPLVLGCVAALGPSVHTPAALTTASSRPAQRAASATARRQSSTVRRSATIAARRRRCRPARSAGGRPRQPSSRRSRNRATVAPPMPPAAPVISATGATSDPREASCRRRRRSAGL